MVMVLLFYREQHKKLAALEMELAAAEQEDFASKNLLENKGDSSQEKAFSCCWNYYKVWPQEQ